jgi:hypothetical protein
LDSGVGRGGSSNRPQAIEGNRLYLFNTEPTADSLPVLRTRVFALRVLERRETNITRPNSRRNFKQMLNGGNRCIDFADLRQNFCAIRFRDWHNNGLVPVTGYGLSSLLQPISLSSDVSIASARNDGVRDRAQTEI